MQLMCADISSLLHGGYHLDLFQQHPRGWRVCPMEGEGATPDSERLLYSIQEDSLVVVNCPIRLHGGLSILKCLNLYGPRKVSIATLSW